MELGQPSRTALLAGMARARHQILDKGRIFRDPLALRILGPELAAKLEADAQRGENRIARLLRGPLAARSRIAEDTLAEAVAARATQYVVLGAGLDTFSLRGSWPRGLARVFEVDHPATQAWKRRLVCDAGLQIPESVTWVPVDFEREEFMARLFESGLSPDQPTVFSWLGVTVYLPRQTVMNTLRSIGTGCAPGSVVVFDYVRRPEPWDIFKRTALGLLSRRYRRMGEPWRCYLRERELRSELPGLGYTRVDFLDPAEIARMLLAGRPLSAAQRQFGGLLGGVVRAWCGPGRP